MAVLGALGASDRANTAIQGARIADLLRPLFALLSFYLLLSAALRLLLWWRFGVEAQVGAWQLPAILVLGAINDLIESLYLFAPFTLYLALTTARWHRNRPGIGLLTFSIWLISFSLLFISAMEVFFFEEFDSRFNLVAVDYLIYPTEVIGDIRSEYPVIRLSLLLSVAAAGVSVWCMTRLKQWPTPERFSASTRLTIIGALSVMILLAVMLWPADRLSVFHNRVSNELVANGPANFFAAFRTNHIDYKQFYRTGDPAHLRTLLARDMAPGGGEFVALASGDLNRRFPARAQGLGKLNVVLLSEESLGAEFVGAYGDPRDLTPEFDALAKQGILFTHAYATGTRTVRGLEAFSASLPPIPSESVIKRQGNENIATWGRVMRGLGYHTSFLYGGFGAFDNMNAYFGHNGFALSDRSDIQRPQFSNIWGVSDGDLLRHAIDYFDARSRESKPFFSIVMTTSNHKPFTFPAGIPHIKPKGGGRKSGTRYADYAIGEFFREARKHPWFDNTIFIIAADHGARAYGRADIPLYSYEIPLLILAPKHLPAARVDTLASQIDVAPTVLGLLGQAYQAPFFGQDVLHWPAGAPRTLLFNHNHDVAALRDGHLCILGLHQSAHCQTYQRSAGAPGPETTHFAQAPDDPELIDLATAYYQTAYEAFVSHRYR